MADIPSAIGADAALPATAEEARNEISRHQREAAEARTAGRSHPLTDRLFPGREAFMARQTRLYEIETGEASANAVRTPSVSRETIRPAGAASAPALTPEAAGIELVKMRSEAAEAKKAGRPHALNDKHVAGREAVLDRMAMLTRIRDGLPEDGSGATDDASVDPDVEQSLDESLKPPEKYGTHLIDTSDIPDEEDRQRLGTWIDNDASAWLRAAEFNDGEAKALFLASNAIQADMKRPGFEARRQEWAKRSESYLVQTYGELAPVRKAMLAGMGDVFIGEGGSKLLADLGFLDHPDVVRLLDRVQLRYVGDEWIKLVGEVAK